MKIPNSVWNVERSIILVRIVKQIWKTVHRYVKCAVMNYCQDALDVELRFQSILNFARNVGSH